MAYPVNHTWNMSVMAYLTDWIFEGQLIEAGIICILPFMALYIPHRCPKCFESAMLKASPQVIWKSKVHW